MIATAKECPRIFRKRGNPSPPFVPAQPPYFLLYILLPAFPFLRSSRVPLFRANPYVNFADDIATVCAQTRRLVSVERKSNRSRSSVADSDKPRATRFNDHVSNPIFHERVFSRERHGIERLRMKKKTKKRVENKPLYVEIADYLLNIFLPQTIPTIFSAYRALPIIAATDKNLLSSYVYSHTVQSIFYFEKCADNEITDKMTFLSYFASLFIIVKVF